MADDSSLQDYLKYDDLLEGKVGLQHLTSTLVHLHLERPESPSPAYDDEEPPKSRLLSLPPEVVRGIFDHVSRLHPRALADSSMSSLCKTCRTLAVIGTPVLYSHFENDKTVFGVRKLLLFWTTLFGHSTKQTETENKPYLVKDNPYLPKADNHLWQYVKSLAITFPAHDNRKKTFNLLGAEASLSEAVARFYIYLLEERTTNVDAVWLSSMRETWKRRCARLFTGKQRFYCEPSDVNQMVSMAMADLITRCQNVESIGWLNDYGSTNSSNRVWKLESKDKMKSLRSVTIAQETLADRGHERTEAWWIPLAACICRNARDVTVRIVAEMAYPFLNAHGPSMDLCMRNHFSLGKDLTTLDFQYSSISPQAMETMLTSCGPLGSFTYFPMPSKTTFSSTEVLDSRYCHSEFVIECLRTHKETLKYLKLVMTPLHFSWGIRRRPLGSLKDFVALSNLTLDTSCYSKHEPLVDILPRQLDTFRLVGCHETMESDLLCLARSHTRSPRSGFPGLCSVELVPWPDESMNPTEDMNLETIRDVFARKGAEFVLLGEEHGWEALFGAGVLLRAKVDTMDRDANEGGADANTNAANTNADENASRVLTSWEQFRRDSHPWAIM